MVELKIQDYNAIFESEMATSEAGSLYAPTPRQCINDSFLQDPFQTDSDQQEDFLKPILHEIFKQFETENFESLTHLNDFEQKIKQNEMSYKDFLQNVAEKVMINADSSLTQIIPAWQRLPNEIKLKTYLQLYCLNQLFKQQPLSEKEMSVLKAACLYQCIGCVNTESKTCKVYVYSFMGAREILC